MIKTLSKAQKMEREKFRIPRSVQDAIPIRRIFADGIFQVGNQYSKTWSFTDINYAIASKEDKTSMFLDYSELLNALDSGASAKITIYNRRINKAEFERSVLLPDKDDGLDEYRHEFNQMLTAQVTGTSNSIVRERYLTVSVVKRNADEARSYFARVGTDLVTHLAQLSSVATELTLTERLHIFRDFFKAGEQAAAEFNMDHIPELSRYDRCRICVPQSCPRDCFLREDCRYQQYLRDSMKPDIQICNHNYLLADASHRQEDRPLLLRSYQALVVDEAHKLPDAARQMYTETLSSRAMDELCLLLQQAHYKDFARQLRTAFLTLSFSCTQGVSKLRRKVSEPFVLTPFRRAALIDCIALLQNAGGLPDVPRYLLNRLGEAESLLRLFLLQVPTRILYIDYDADGQPTFCAASSRVPQLLRSALWNTREPAILTSGTLAAAGDFSHTEQLLGLAAYRPLRHFRADSPFDYKKKCLLYFPPCVKTRMDNRKMAEEIVRLVDACHGHALVLFTSYRQMAEVRALTDGQWTYPTYQAWRNGGKIIQKFKQSGNGVLFAAGSCWEGIDFPGDMVSLLIIAKLPFPIPDPVSDYERRQYPNLRDYINAEVIPEMQKKLRQGFGRAIRTEHDSCVVAILDERAGIGGRYHDAALAALPSCPTTEKIEDVQQFIREQKRPDYFL